MSWLWLRSTTSATTLFSGSRCSSRSTGLVNASTSAASAPSLNSAPRCLKNSPASTSASIGAAIAASHAQEISGSKEIDQSMAPYCPSRSSRLGTCTWSDL